MIDGDISDHPDYPLFNWRFDEPPVNTFVLLLQQRIFPLTESKINYFIAEKSDETGEWFKTDGKVIRIREGDRISWQHLPHNPVISGSLPGELK